MDFRILYLCTLLSMYRVQLVSTLDLSRADKPDKSTLEVAIKEF